MNFKHTIYAATEIPKTSSGRERDAIRQRMLQELIARVDKENAIVFGPLWGEIGEFTHCYFVTVEITKAEEKALKTAFL